MNEDPTRTGWRRVVFGPNPISSRDPRLQVWRIHHRLFGPRSGCSCSRCFTHPKRRVPASEFYSTRQRLAAVEQWIQDYSKAQRQAARRRQR